MSNPKSDTSFIVLIITGFKKVAINNPTTHAFIPIKQRLTRSLLLKKFQYGINPNTSKNEGIKIIIKHKIPDKILFVPISRVVPKNPEKVKSGPGIACANP